MNFKISRLPTDWVSYPKPLILEKSILGFFEERLRNFDEKIIHNRIKEAFD